MLDPTLSQDSGPQRTHTDAVFEGGYSFTLSTLNGIR